MAQKITTILQKLQECIASKSDDEVISVEDLKQKLIDLKPYEELLIKAVYSHGLADGAEYINNLDMKEPTAERFIEKYKKPEKMEEENFNQRDHGDEQPETIKLENQN